MEDKLKDYWLELNEEDQLPEPPNDYKVNRAGKDKETGLRNDNDMKEIIVQNSRFIHQILYRKSKRRLIIRFKDGKVYRYEGVEPRIGDWLLNGQNVGFKFNSKVRNNDLIEYERVA